MKHVDEAKRRECLHPGCSRPSLYPSRPGLHSTAFLANTAGPQFCSRACADEDFDELTIFTQHHVDEETCALPGCWEYVMRFVTWRSLHFCCEAHRVLHAGCDGGHALTSEPYIMKEITAYRYPVPLGAWVRCMLLADVAAGNALVTTTKNLPPMWSPPPGIHSVVGEVGPNKVDELVCYDPVAALPTHFIVYRP
eukprot:g12748.t2